MGRAFFCETPTATPVMTTPAATPPSTPQNQPFLYSGRWSAGGGVTSGEAAPVLPTLGGGATGAGLSQPLAVGKTLGSVGAGPLAGGALVLALPFYPFRGVTQSTPLGFFGFSRCRFVQLVLVLLSFDRISCRLGRCHRFLRSIDFSI